jgi:anti-sigma-K factor RskA
MLKGESRKATIAALAVCAVLLAVGWQRGAAGPPTVVDLASHEAQQQTLATEAFDDTAFGCSGNAPGMANPAARTVGVLAGMAMVTSRSAMENVPLNSTLSMPT